MHTCASHYAWHNALYQHIACRHHSPPCGVFRNRIAPPQCIAMAKATPTAKPPSTPRTGAKASPSHAELVAQALQRTCWYSIELIRVQKHKYTHFGTDHRHDDHQLMVAITAPAVRVALGEALGMPPGTVVTPQLVTALKQLGFDAVYGMWR